MGGGEGGGRDARGGETGGGGWGACFSGTAIQCNFYHFVVHNLLEFKSCQFIFVYNIIRPHPRCTVLLFKTSWCSGGVYTPADGE